MPDVQPRKPSHPLEPLTPAEIARVVEIVRAESALPSPLLFEMIELKEPAKPTVRGFEPGAAFPREARANMFQKGSIGVWRLVVSLDAGRVTSMRHLPQARPMVQLEEFMHIEGLVKADPDFIAACRRRGITEMERVCVDPWSAGTFGIEGEEGRHLCHTFAWLRPGDEENYYAHPIEGLNAVVDIKRQEVVRVDDHGVVPIPMGRFEYSARSQERTRGDLRPIDIVQPEGVSFRLDGHALKWHDWSLVVGFNAREALTLHDIRYAGRPVLYRASVAEMVVPYGAPHGGHFRKNVFDIGEYGIGKLTNSLKLGCDCLGSIAYLDAWMGDMNGGLFHIENAVCVHEEDYGILWKHWDFRTDRTEVRRARRLVISSIASVGNYEYGFYWYLYLDGCIELEIKATGVINTTACVPGRPSKFGREVAPGVVGQIHQHVFCARLDLAIDGARNSVVESNAYPEPAESNPYGNAFYEEETVFARESEAARRTNAATQRYWKFINPSKKNRVGRPTGYKLEARDCLTPFLAPESPSGRRSAYIQNHLWVSAYDPDERFPSGDYVNNSDGSDGIHAYVRKDRPIENADIVAWHVFGLHHLPRPEDFPVQPCISCGFRLMPYGFFDRNPCLDLPSGGNKASCHAAAAR
jgi:primary-amine oxidase